MLQDVDWESSRCPSMDDETVIDDAFNAFILQRGIQNSLFRSYRKWLEDTGNGCFGGTQS